MQTHTAPNFSRRLVAAFAVAFGVMAAGLLSAPAANAKIWFEGGVFGSSAVSDTVSSPISRKAAR